MTVDEVREVLEAGGRVRAVVGDGPDDPTVILYLKEGMVMCEAVAGWSAGVVEPMCALGSDFLAESLARKVRVERVLADAVGWSQRGSMP